MARRRSLKKFLASRPVAAIANRLAALLLRALGRTWRVVYQGPDPFEAGEGPHLGAFWHRNALIAAYLFRDRGFSVPVSQSRDGDLITGLLLALGYTMPPRGSSTRGGAAALRGIVRMVEEGTTISIQTDGPLGPARISKHGMVSLARRTRRPVTPLALSASPCIQFDSWDATLLPWPFAKIHCHFAPPIEVPPEATPEEEDAARRELDAVLNELTDEVDLACGLVDPRRPTSDRRP